jgi:hypothetical protein
MPQFLRSLNPFSRKDTVQLNRYGGFTDDGRVVMRDSRDTVRAEAPDVETKGFGNADPLAIYKPSSTKQVDAQKAMANFTGWTFAAVNAIASEVANIQLRLFQLKGDNHEERDDHPLLTLLEGVNEHMTGIELKYVTIGAPGARRQCVLAPGRRQDRHGPAACDLPAQSGPREGEARQVIFPLQAEVLLSDSIRPLPSPGRRRCDGQAHIYEGMPHNFATRLPEAPESKAARKKIADFARKYLGDAPPR